MWKFIGYITIAFGVGAFSMMLTNKIITLSEIKEAAILFYKGFLRRFDDSVVGNDGHYSSVRIMEYMWGIGTFSLLCLCVLRDIKIQEGVLYLFGAALGFGNIKSAFNKAQEIKDSVKNKEGQNVAQA